MKIERQMISSLIKLTFWLHNHKSHSMEEKPKNIDKSAKFALYHQVYERH